MTRWNLQRIRSVTLAGGLAMAVAVMIGLLGSTIAQANTPTPIDQAPISGEPVAIYFFWGNGCPHCAAAKPVLAEISRQYPNVQLRAYEVWYDQANQELFQRMAAALRL